MHGHKGDATKDCDPLTFTPVQKTSPVWEGSVICFQPVEYGKGEGFCKCSSDPKWADCELINTECILGRSDLCESPY